MKKTIVLMFMLLIGSIGSTLIAQNASSSHLDFKGIPIDGKIEDFVIQLINKGYNKSETTDEAVMLNGSFAGEDVEIVVYSTKRSKTVYMVVVLFPKQTSWYSLKSDFTNMENSLKNKYGKTKLQKKTFSRPYEEGDGYEMSAVKLGKCTYASSFTTEYGEITLLIMKSGRLGLYYVDNINNEKNEKEEKTTIYEDL